MYDSTQTFYSGNEVVMRAATFLWTAVFAVVSLSGVEARAAYYADGAGRVPVTEATVQTAKDDHRGALRGLRYVRRHWRFAHRRWKPDRIAGAHDELETWGLDLLDALREDPTERPWMSQRQERSDARFDAPLYDAVVVLLARGTATQGSYAVGVDMEAARRILADRCKTLRRTDRALRHDRRDDRKDTRRERRSSSDTA